MKEADVQIYILHQNHLEVQGLITYGSGNGRGVEGYGGGGYSDWGYGGGGYGGGEEDYEFDEEEEEWDGRAGAAGGASGNANYATMATAAAWLAAAKGSTAGLRGLGRRDA